MHHVEALEPRMLLATVTWDGGAGTDSWHDAMNWSGDVLPGPLDDVVIDVAGEQTIEFTTGITAVKSLDNAESLELFGGTLFVNENWIQRGVLTMTGGTADGAADLVVKAGLDWSGGTIKGQRTIIEAAAFAAISDNVFLESVLKSFGVLSWTGGNIAFHDGTINNQGFMTVSTDGAALDHGGINVIGNNANMTRQNAGGTDTQTTFNVPLTGAGSLALASGNLRLNASSEFFGDVIVQAGTLFRLFGQASRFALPSSISGDGIVSFAGGINHEIKAALDFQELSVVNGAQVSLAQQTGTIARLDLDGSLTDVGGLTISERIRIFDGQMSGGGPLTIADDALMLLDLDGAFAQVIDVDNHGTLVLDQGTWILRNVSVDNHAEMFLRSGTITPSNVNSKSEIENHSGAVITKHTPDSVSILGFAFNKKVTVDNHGLIRTLEGMLTIDGGGTSHADGSIIAAAGATLQFKNRTFLIQGDVGGGGAVKVAKTGIPALAGAGRRRSPARHRARRHRHGLAKPPPSNESSSAASSRWSTRR